MFEEKSKTQVSTVGHSIIKFVSDTDGDVVLDTEVQINDKVICIIAGEDIEKFLKTLQAIVEVYRI